MNWRFEYTLLSGIILVVLLMVSCKINQKQADNDMVANDFTGAPGEVKLMTLDPGHFHAALILKSSYEGINDTIHVYAPDGPDVQEYIDRVNGFNSRAQSPTSWIIKTYKGPDYLNKMVTDKPGNLMLTSGNNARKTEYILKTIGTGINVLADKPMGITPEDFILLEKAFMAADENGVLLYDVMTERYEITNILCRELAWFPELFGELSAGTLEQPAISKESVHHLFKYVAGKPLKRPAWYFDTKQQGEGLVDVNTHLIDLIQWEAFPEQILHKSDVEILSAQRWTTDLSPSMFEKVTHLDHYPEYLKEYVDGDILRIFCNGEINYKLKGIHVKASVVWNFMAPDGGGDTHYSIMRGSKCNLIIEQGRKENFKPTLYIEPSSSDFSPEVLEGAVDHLSYTYPGIGLRKISPVRWAIDIPDIYKEGHEAHFAQVTKKYMEYLMEGKLPEWEVPNMIVKYYTTTEGLRLAKERPLVSN